MRGGVGCGILLDAGTTRVTLGTNTFPNPEGSVPGNEQSVCDSDRSVRGDRCPDRDRLIATHLPCIGMGNG
jgi:hypothetical protein